jgi:hypothetical protein
MSATLTIHNSVWASRAWTYQEGYMSKRRLIFTDHQTIFLCNEDILWDGTNNAPKVGGLSYMPLGHASDLFPYQMPSYSSGMERAMDYLRTYSDRALSYDYDALNAISGILNTLPKHHGEAVYHISGVPFVALSKPHQSVWIALDWLHEWPCRRRSNMPSWSSLAWDGKMNWLDSEARPLVPRDCRIALGTRTQYIDIEQLATQFYTLADFDGSRGLHFLEITTYIVELPRATTDRQDDLQESTEPRFVLALNNDVEMVIQPCWDRVVTQDNAAAPLLALIFTDDISIASFEANPSPMVMVVEAHGSYYERVALFPKKMFKVSWRVLFRPRTTPSPVEHGGTHALSDTYAWLQQARKRRILLV